MHASTYKHYINHALIRDPLEKSQGTARGFKLRLMEAFQGRVDATPSARWVLDLRVKSTPIGRFHHPLERSVERVLLTFLFMSLVLDCFMVFCIMRGQTFSVASDL